MVNLGRLAPWAKHKVPLSRNVVLVGGWTNPIEKYARQIGNLPQIGVEIKNAWNHDIVAIFTLKIRLCVLRIRIKPI